MRCGSSYVGPLVVAALILAVALILAALGTDRSTTSIAILALAGGYVALYPGRGCCPRRPVDAAEA